MEDLNKLTIRVKESLVKQILNVKAYQLDKPYIGSSHGTWTRRELAKEISDETEIGMRHIEMLLNLTLDLLARNKEKL